MRRILALFLTALFLCLPVSAIGDSNMESGGGSTHHGSAAYHWLLGDDGVRVTVIRSRDHACVTVPIDYTNKQPNIKMHFGKVCKMTYNQGRAIHPLTTPYYYKNPEQRLPRIVTDNGRNNLPAIKSYFTDEQVIRSIADVVHMDFDTLTNGTYKLLIEPVAYLTYDGRFTAMTATEAALYNQSTSGKLRSWMKSLTHKNLPLALFLEVPDLGYPSWPGSRNSLVSDGDILSSLGLGVVRFNEETEPPVTRHYDEVYRPDTDVITAVTVSGGQSDPDHPISVTFNVMGRNYRVRNVYYPSGNGQLAWVKWHTPGTEQDLSIRVSASGSARTSKSTLRCKIESLDQNSPPNPLPDDCCEGFIPSPVPKVTGQASASWSVWSPWWQEHWVWHSNRDGGGSWMDEGWWTFDLKSYRADLLTTMDIVPDRKNPTSYGTTMKSGYGVEETASAVLTTNQSSAVTEVQTAVTYFPEFHYGTYWRKLDRVANRFHFAKNPYSTYGNRSHFTPLWYPDGPYTPSTWTLDCWTPAGMLSTTANDSVTIRGSLWDDWHIGPKLT